MAGFPSAWRKDIVHAKRGLLQHRERLIADTPTPRLKIITCFISSPYAITKCIVEWGAQISHNQKSCPDAKSSFENKSFGSTHVVLNQKSPAFQTLFRQKPVMVQAGKNHTMLQQFSWTTFLIFFSILSALWYIMLLLTVYRKETIGLISGPNLKPPTVIGSDSLGNQEWTEPIADQIMGKSKMPEGLEVVSISALNFSVGGDSAYSADDAKSDQLGLIPDVLEEIKEIFSVLGKEDGTKQDFFSLAAMISEKYGRIGSNPNIGQINAFIRDHAPFAVTIEELEYLWD